MVTTATVAPSTPRQMRNGQVARAVSASPTVGPSLTWSGLRPVPARHSLQSRAPCSPLGSCSLAWQSDLRSPPLARLATPRQRAPYAVTGRIVQVEDRGAHLKAKSVELVMAPGGATTPLEVLALGASLKPGAEPWRKLDVHGKLTSKLKAKAPEFVPSAVKEEGVVMRDDMICRDELNLGSYSRLLSCNCGTCV
eukprot:g27616.t1